MSELSTTTINSAKNLVRKMIVSNFESMKKGLKVKNMPIFLHSPPGIGKSAITAQISDDLKSDDQDFGFIDVRLGTMEQSDVCGIPYVGTDADGNTQMQVSIPAWFPTEERVEAGKFPKYGIVFFDELSNAPQGVQHAAYRIIHEREVQQGVKMADGWQIVAAGNLKSDKTGAKGVLPAMANRFAFHLHIRPSIDDFRAYAVDTKMEQEVIGFLSWKEGALYDKDGAKTDVAFATPRSWEQVSNLLRVGYSDDELSLVLSGCVGDAKATDFMTFRRFYDRLPDMEAIMDGKAEWTVPKKDLGLIFAVTSAVIVALAANASNKERVKNLESRIMNQLDDEYLVLVYKSLKNLGDKRASAQVLMNTMATFKRISHYVDADKKMD